MRETPDRAQFRYMRGLPLDQSIMQANILCISPVAIATNKQSSSLKAGESRTIRWSSNSNSVGQTKNGVGTHDGLEPQ